MSETDKAVEKIEDLAPTEDPKGGRSMEPAKLEFPNVVHVSDGTSNTILFSE